MAVLIALTNVLHPAAKLPSNSFTPASRGGANAPWTTLLGAFFVLVSCTGCTPPEVPLAAGGTVEIDCAPYDETVTATGKKVFDGDTVALTDGRRVRLLGINAPELGHNGAPDQPYAQAARNALQTFLDDGHLDDGQPVALLYDRERRDRYGRELAHLYRHDGANAETHLLRQGLAYHIAILPNTTLADCLASVAEVARGQQRGLWRDSRATPARDVKEGGYQRVTGRIAEIKFAKTWWVELEGGVTGVINPAAQASFSRLDVEAWRGQTVEISGWVYSGKNPRYAPWRMSLSTPHAVRVSP